MAESDEKNWLDEAFDDEKTAQDIERAQRARRVGYFLAAVMLAVIAIITVSCTGMLEVVNLMQ